MDAFAQFVIIGNKTNSTTSLLDGKPPADWEDADWPPEEFEESYDPTAANAIQYANDEFDASVITVEEANQSLPYILNQTKLLNGFREIE